jgi:hypothetical protein
LARKIWRKIRRKFGPNMWGVLFVVVSSLLVLSSAQTDIRFDFKGTNKQLFLCNFNREYMEPYYAL